MPNRRAEIKKNLKGPTGPRFGGPQGGRPGSKATIAPLGIQPANKREGKRSYLKGSPYMPFQGGRDEGNLAPSLQGQINKYKRNRQKRKPKPSSYTPVADSGPKLV